MTNYIFSPAPTMGVGDHPFVTWDGGFTEQELQSIIEYCDKLPVSPATLGDSEVHTEYRRSDVAWVPSNPETMWIFDRLAWILKQLNSQFYQFDMYGFCEDAQYTVYNDYCQGNYDWHVDAGATTSAPRKLSLVLQLSNPEEYSGGNLEILTGRDSTAVNKKLGLISVFPSYVLHRVTPVTEGTRKSLVIWASGPKFR